MCPKTQQGKYYCIACSVHCFSNGCTNNKLMGILKTPSCPSDPFFIGWEGRDLAEEKPTRTILVLSFNFSRLPLLLLCFGFNLVCCFLCMQGPWALRRACQVMLDLLHWEVSDLGWLDSRRKTFLWLDRVDWCWRWGFRILKWSRTAPLVD